MKIVILWLVALTLGVLFALWMQHQFELEYRSHWHYSPKSITISVDEPRISNNVPYHLTKSTPKQTESTGYVYWSYVCYRR